MGKFRVSKIYLHKKKSRAEKKAVELRNFGYRAEVHPSSKTTRKRSPSLKWAVLKGQLRDARLPTAKEVGVALKSLDRDYVSVKKDIATGYKDLVKKVNSANVSKTKKDQELARLKARRTKALNTTKQRYVKEQKRLKAFPTRSVRKRRR